jgi:DNA polymerase-1
MGILPAISTMMETGMGLDKDHLIRLKSRLTTEMEQLNEAANIITGFETDINSPDKVAELLFSPAKLGIRTKHKIKLTDSGKREQVDGDVLEVIRNEHEVIPIIIDYRERSKLRSTYTTSLIRLVNPSTDRLHTELLPTRTSTGRLASKNPNQQNIPVRTALGKEIRKAFVPRPGNWIGSIDMSQIELRVLASERNVSKMMEVLWAKGDLHTETAIEVFQRDRDQLYRAISNTKLHPPKCDCAECSMVLQFRNDQRSPCKNVNFGIVYEITPPGLATLIASSGGDKDYWTEPKCEWVIQKWYGVYPEVLEGSKLQGRRAVRTNMVWDALGRFTYVPEMRSVHTWIISQGKRRIANFHIQSFAAGILKLAVAEIHDMWESYWRKYGVELLILVHDELLAEGPKAVLEDFLYYCGEVFEHCCPLKVPIGYGVAMSEQSWGHIPK